MTKQEQAELQALREETARLREERQKKEDSEPDWAGAWYNTTNELK